jgi:hypothetical protein
MAPLRSWIFVLPEHILALLKHNRTLQADSQQNHTWQTQGSAQIETGPTRAEAERRVAQILERHQEAPLRSWPRICRRVERCGSRPQ